MSSVQLSATWPSTIAYGQTKIGIPYSEVLDGGTGPNYFDCSGLMQNIFRWAGDSQFTRTTYSQWADERYEHLGPYAFGEAPPAQAGWIAYIHVDGEADPGHVGLCLGNGTYLNAPHTGEDIQIAPIPNSESEHVYGYLVPIYRATTVVTTGPVPGSPTQQPTATPTPTSAPQQESVYMIATGCTDDGAVQAQIKEWWIANRNDELTGNILTLLMENWAITAGAPGPFGSTGFGRNPFLLLSNIVDTAGAHSLHPGEV